MSTLAPPRVVTDGAASPPAARVDSRSSATPTTAEPRLLRPARFAHLLVFSILTGFLAVAQWSLIPAQRHLDAAAYTVLEQHMNDVLEYLTATLMVASTLLAAAVAWFTTRTRPGRRPVILAAVALVAIVAMVITTLTINAPVNFAIDGWDPTAPPTDWLTWRRRWEIGHAVRTYVGLLGLAAALAAAIWPGGDRPDASVGDERA